MEFKSKGAFFKKDSPDEESGFGFAERNAKSVLRFKIRRSDSPHWQYCLGLPYKLRGENVPAGEERDFKSTIKIANSGAAARVSFWI